MNSESVPLTTHILTFVKYSRIPGRSTTLMMPRRRRSFLNCLCLMCLETNCLFGTNVIVIQLQSCTFLRIFYHSTIHRALFTSIIFTKQKGSSETNRQNLFNSVNNSKMTSKSPQGQKNLILITQFRCQKNWTVKVTLIILLVCRNHLCLTHF